MKTPKTLRDLDAMDNMLDSDFSNDAGVRRGVGISQAYQSPEMRLKQKKFKEHNEQSIEAIRLANIGKNRKGEEWIKGMAEKNKGNGYRNKFFSTPSGVFLSKKQAIEWATENGVRNASGKFDQWVKNPNSGFCYISEEEYNKQKNKKLIVGLEWMLNNSKSPRYKNS